MTQSLLDDVIARIAKLPDSQRDQVIQEAIEATKNMVWVPNPGPQTVAFNSLADELYYGGQAGGGKSDLGIGAALTSHEQSLILRRFSADADSLAERAIQASSEHVPNGDPHRPTSQPRLLEPAGPQRREDPTLDRPQRPEPSHHHQQALHGDRDDEHRGEHHQDHQRVFLQMG